jgi:hypothetical protein
MREEIKNVADALSSMGTFLPRNDKEEKEQ